MKKYIKYAWPDEVIHALGDMGMIAPGIVQKQSYRLIEKSQSFILNIDSTKDRLLSIIPPLLASMIHEEKTQIILLGHKEELLSSSFDMREYNKYTQYRFITSYPGTNTFEECQTIHNGIDILFTTPTKLLEYIRRKVIDTNFVSYLIYQESNQFSNEEIREIKEIKKHMPLDCASILYGLNHHKDLKDNINTTLHEYQATSHCTHFITEDAYFNSENKQVIFVQSYEAVLYYQKKFNTELVIHQFMNRASQYRIMHEFNKKGGLLIVSDIASRYLSLCCETVIHIGVHDLYQYMSHLTHVKGVMHSYIYDTNMTEKQLKIVLKQPVITISKEDYKKNQHLLYETINKNPDVLYTLEPDKLIAIIHYLAR